MWHILPQKWFLACSALCSYLGWIFVPTLGRNIFRSCSAFCSLLVRCCIQLLPYHTHTTLNSCPTALNFVAYHIKLCTLIFEKYHVELVNLPFMESPDNPAWFLSSDDHHQLSLSRYSVLILKDAALCDRIHFIAYLRSKAQLIDELLLAFLNTGIQLHFCLIVRYLLSFQLL